MSDLEHRDTNGTTSPRWRSVPTQAAAIWGGYWLLLLVTGQPIDLRPVYAGWQNLPVAALRAHPVTSVFDLHIQPPLWNLVVGAVVGWSPFTTTVTMGIVLFVSGLVLAASVAAILVRLRVPRGWALAITAAATMNTHLLVYAFNGGYDLPVAALLGVLMWVIVGTQRPRAAWFGVAAATTTIAMGRSLYHPVWALIVLVIVGWELRHRLTRREVVMGALIPVVFMGGWITLNGVRHGTPTLSSWTGMNLLRSVYPTVSKPDLRELYENGDISGVALAGPFRAYSAYEQYLGECEVDSDRLGLTITTRPIPPPLRVPGRFYSEAAPNFNYECYIEAYNMAGSDAWTIMWKKPDDWVKARVWAADNWFEAPPVYEPKRSPLWRPTDVVTGVLYLRTPHPPLPEGWRDFDLWVHGSPQTAMVGINWLAGFIAVASFGIGSWRRRHIDDAGEADAEDSDVEDSDTEITDDADTGTADAGAANAADIEAEESADAARPISESDLDWALRRRTLIAVMGVTLAWTAFAGIFIELGEQGRFRAVTDPFVLSAVAVMNWRWYRPRLQRWWDRRSEKRATDGAVGSTPAT